MKKNTDLPTIETILDGLGIDLDRMREQDATEIVKLILVYMIEESARTLENTEIPIGDMLWVENK